MNIRFYSPPPFSSQFRVQSTLTGVAQAVVDKVVRIHHDFNMSNSTSSSGKREDITLLVRNFNYPLPHALSSPTANCVRFNPIVETAPLTLMQDLDDYSSVGTGATERSVDTSTTSTTSDVYPPGGIDPNAKIKAYVDFSEYFENVDKRRREGTLPEGLDL